MGREIKFRAWDKMSNKMRQVINIDLCPEFGGAWFWGKAYVGFDDGEHEADKDFLVWQQMEPLMQYTGLKDAKGVEIYEGDIVRESATGHSGWVEWLEEGELGNFQIKNDWTNSMMYSPECLEVIGNIYETTSSDRQQ